jgi:hypothetical protein
MAGFATVAIAGITTIVATYLLLSWSGNAQKIAGGYTSSYRSVARTFAGS